MRMSRAWHFWPTCEAAGHNGEHGREQSGGGKGIRGEVHACVRARARTAQHDEASRREGKEPEEQAQSVTGERGLHLQRWALVAE